MPYHNINSFYIKIYNSFQYKNIKKMPKTTIEFIYKSSKKELSKDEVPSFNQVKQWIKSEFQPLPDRYRCVYTTSKGINLVIDGENEFLAALNDGDYKIKVQVQECQAGDIKNDNKQTKADQKQNIKQTQSQDKAEEQTTKRKQKKKQPPVQFPIKCCQCSKMPIIQNLYKCIQCENYFLCQQCEDKNNHKHYFIVIRKLQHIPKKVTFSIQEKKPIQPSRKNLNPSGMSGMGGLGGGLSGMGGLGGMMGGLGGMMGGMGGMMGGMGGMGGGLGGMGGMMGGMGGMGSGLGGMGGLGGMTEMGKMGGMSGLGRMKPDNQNSTIGIQPNNPQILGLSEAEKRKLIQEAGIKIVQLDNRMNQQIVSMLLRTILDKLPIKSTEQLIQVYFATMEAFQQHQKQGKLPAGMGGGMGGMSGMGGMGGMMGGMGGMMGGMGGMMGGMGGMMGGMGGMMGGMGGRR